MAGAGIGALVTGIVGSVSISAAGAPAIQVEVDGHTVTFPSPPQLINSTVYVPVRALADALGVPVHWNGATDTVQLGTASNGPTANGFVYQGVRYQVEGLQVRSYPGGGTTNGDYWIVSYSLTNATASPVNVPQQQPTLVLFGPAGVQLAADASLSGPTATVVNPGLTFSSYLVFQVPSGTEPAAYSLGFDTYQVQGGQFTTTPLSAALPANGASQAAAAAGTYALSDVWNNQTQTLALSNVVKSTAIAPDLSAASFDPTASVWIVDLQLSDPGTANINVSAGDFALDLGGASIAPMKVGSLPGYVTPSNLDNGGSVVVPSTTTFSGSLVFSVPAGLPTSAPALSLTIGNQLRVISLLPCASQVCPPVLQ